MKDTNLDRIYCHDIFLEKIYSVDFCLLAVYLFFNQRVIKFKVTLKEVERAL